ncbi:MAG: hypothetical protein ABIV94_11045 [Acidimicrobiales bacterium]
MTRLESRRPAQVASFTGVLCAATAWIVRPDNQLGRTRPTTLWASAAIVFAATGILVGANATRRTPRSGVVAVFVGIVALIAAGGALILLQTLPNGH